MFIKLTDTDDKPVFVNPGEIVLIEWSPEETPAGARSIPAGTRIVVKGGVIPIKQTPQQVADAVIGKPGLRMEQGMLGEIVVAEDPPREKIGG